MEKQKMSLPDEPWNELAVLSYAVLQTAKNVVAIDPGLPPSDRNRCGEMRLGGLFEDLKLKSDQRTRITESCYDVKPSSAINLTISFYEGHRVASPKGVLQLKATRGKLEPTRLELDGKQEKVRVKYTAPDETVKVSIRALLDGFRRGKIHLHLE